MREATQIWNRQGFFKVLISLNVTNFPNLFLLEILYFAKPLSYPRRQVLKGIGARQILFLVHT